MADGHERVEKKSTMDKLISVGVECISSHSENDSDNEIEIVYHDLQAEDYRSNDHDDNSIGHGEGRRDSNGADTADKSTTDEDANGTFSR